jgi:GNAT superfamily N-acetyltransferase
MLQLLSAVLGRMPLVFQASERLTRLIPARLFRLRLFGIFQVSLAGKSIPDRALPGTRPVEASVAWITSHTEAIRCASHFDLANGEGWDGVHHQGVVANWRGTPAGIAWLRRDGFEESDLGVQFLLTKSEVWLFGASVARQFRRRGVYTQILERLRQDLPDQGICRLLLAVTCGNSASSTAHRRIGARRIGLALALRVGGWTWLVTDQPDRVRVMRNRA